MASCGCIHNGVQCQQHQATSHAFTLEPHNALTLGGTFVSWINRRLIIARHRRLLDCTWETATRNEQERIKWPHGRKLLLAHAEDKLGKN